MTSGSPHGRTTPDQSVTRGAESRLPDQPQQDQAPQDQAPQDQAQHKPREADGWQILSYMLGGMILYGGIGWLVSHFTGIAVLFPVGMILGIGLSVAMIIFRFNRT